MAIVGKKPGTTVLNLWFPDPRDPNNPQKDRTLSYMVVVLADPERAALEVLAERKRLEAQVKAFEQALKVLEREIKEAFPDSAVQLSLVGEQVVVRGEAKDVVEAAQILRIVAEHSPTRRRTAVNLSNNVNVTFIPGLGDQAAAVDAIRQLLAGNPNMVNLLRVPGEQQVMLMVTVAEVDRTAARTIGMDFSISKGQFTFAQVGHGGGRGGRRQPAGVHRQRQHTPGHPGPANHELRAEPGGTQPDHARWQVGELSGRRVLPHPQQRHSPRRRRQSVTYQNFGVSLQFTPYITDRNRIRLQLNASVSTPSTATTSVNGAQVPSQITQRQFNTTVELREGQTLTVAGLIQNNFSGTSNRVPLWGDLPHHRADRRRGQHKLRRAGARRPGHARAGASPGAVSDAAADRQQHFRAGRRGVLSPGPSGRPAERGLPRFGPHRLRPPGAILRVQRPVHHRPARHDLRLLQPGQWPLSMSPARRGQSGCRTGAARRPRPAGDCARAEAAIETKSEIRSSKSETNPKCKVPKAENKRRVPCAGSI